jgi:formamidopyrimidine-DNA glycosylase
VPELPEVEVVRTGLARWVAGRRVASVEVLHPRAIRRHVPGPADFAARLTGRVFGEARRRGKYFWVPLGDPADSALLGHLGMSGQMLVGDPGRPREKHLRVRFTFDDGGGDLRFVDQRTFGGLLVADLVPDAAATTHDAALLPLPIAHIAADPMDPAFDDEAFTTALRRRDTEIKRALLDQSLISGVGNIYADEALWRARLHGRRPTRTLTRPEIARVLAAVREVMGAALASGGTSFDSLYVNVNGESGYFDRSLEAYGREGEPCRRCGTPIRRQAFMNRSSYFCPHCQPVPRRRVPAARPVS